MAQNDIMKIIDILNSRNRSLDYQAPETGFHWYSTSKRLSEWFCKHVNSCFRYVIIYEDEDILKIEITNECDNMVYKADILFNITLPEGAKKIIEKEGI